MNSSGDNSMSLQCKSESGRSTVTSKPSCVPDGDSSSWKMPNLPQVKFANPVALIWNNGFSMAMEFHKSCLMKLFLWSKKNCERLAEIL
ncbi:hypothetical protein NC651_031094 [Populus alba x Populus x berolinensis]|nr:hypothetical protein NC651_031094 [Populus alba x Populus x berolinensis]